MEAILSAQRKRDATNPLADKVDDDSFFKYFYLPFIIMDVFYDHVDTVLITAAEMRIEPLKKICRQIKSLKAEYDYLNKKCMDYESRKAEKRTHGVFH